MSEELIWKQIKNEDGVLLYEGFTMFDKPYGKGKTFFSNGNVYQDGQFSIKGLIDGKEYYPSGQLRFEGTYTINKAYGPNFPVRGKCYDENGKLYHNGKIHCSFGGVGYPTVRFPTKYGPIPQSDKPDVDYFMWKDDEKRKKQKS